MYVNTPGTSTPDGRAIGFETEAFAISDCMNYIKPPVYTIGVGQVLMFFLFTSFFFFFFVAGFCCFFRVWGVMRLFLG